MPDSVAESWSRIEDWLASHAPVTFATLNPPASSEAIADVELTLGVALPDQLTTSLLRRDGSGEDWWTPGRFVLPGDYGLMTTELIEKTWRMITGLFEAAEDADAIAGIWWHPQWVPIANTNTADVLVIDQRPGPSQGRIGDHLKEQTYFESWDSYAAMLADVADGLEQQRPVDEAVPHVVDGALRWRGPDPRDLLASGP